MMIDSARHDFVSERRSRKRLLLGMGATVLAAIVVVMIAALALSGVQLAGDATALARVSVQPLGGTIEHVEAFGAHGERVPLAVHDGRITPLRRLHPGERASGGVK